MPIKCDQLCFGEEARNGRIDRSGPLRVKISGKAKTDEQCRAILGKAVADPVARLETVRVKPRAASASAAAAPARPAPMMRMSGLDAMLTTAIRDAKRLILKSTSLR